MLRGFGIWAAVVLALLVALDSVMDRSGARRPSAPPSQSQPRPPPPPPESAGVRPPVQPPDANMPVPPPLAGPGSTAGVEAAPGGTPGASTRPPLPGLTGQDYVITVNSDGPRQTDGLGTAFALDPAGVWLTAAHVVDDCKAVFVRRGNDWRPARSVRLHPSADVAVIYGIETGPAVTFGAHATPVVGQNAFHVGFPQGKPAQVWSRYIGQARIERKARGLPPEPGHVWVEVERSPDFEGSLGGLSGGPTFDSRGRLVGVTILESSRRGRITTAPLDRVGDLLRMTRTEAKPAAPPVAISAEDFTRVGQALRAAGTVTAAFCSWKGDTVPRRR
ncbi:MAG: trypsin-like peptidase domain-containing protein [Rhodospirillales bacterium]|nr:MAG: trypsin-like peptidase domain-containing protein [Rhodospirillales bacterium]